MESINIFLIASCVVIVLLALLLIDAYSLNRKLRKKLSEYKEKNKSSVENNDTKPNGESIKIAELNKALSDASNKIFNLEYSLKAEKEKYLQQIDALNLKEIFPGSSAYNVDTTTTINTPVQSNIKFARYADQGDGFSVSELLNEEDDETIFQITQEGFGTATFRISYSQNAQRYALSNAAYFLGKTCKYDSTPSGNSYIVTDVVGDLKLQGSKWLIVNPAKISFS